MPAKKNLKKKTEKKFDLQNLVKTPESYKSLIYGIVTVIILLIVIILGVRQLQKNKANIADNGVKTNIENTASTNKTYTVNEGDTLWSVAQKEYGDGFKWEIIAKANGITDPSSLEKGTKLDIPELSPTPMVTVTPASSPTPAIGVNNNLQNQPQKITEDKYTVVHGDYLWEIAIRAYGDGYRWVDIAKANNLSNPNLIFSGNELKLPRP